MKVIIHSLNDILTKLLSTDDKPFDAILLTNVLVKIWNTYAPKTSEEVAKLMIDIVYELSESHKINNKSHKNGHFRSKKQMIFQLEG